MTRVASGDAQLQTSWQTVSLSEVCDFKPSKDIPRDMLADDADVSFVPMNDLGELVKYFETKEVRKFSEVVKSYTYFADGDVLCAKITPCFENGKLGIASSLESGVGFGSSEFVVMRPKPALSAEFLYYYLSRDAFREAGARVMSGAVGHKRVPKEYFEDLPIPLPSLDEQKRIVAVLDQAFSALDRARAHAEANLADVGKLDEVFLDDQIASLTKSFGLIRIDALADVKGGKRLPKGVKSDAEVTPYPYITVRDMDNGSIRLDTVGFISQEVQRAIQRYIISCADIYVSIAGTIGKTGVVPEALDGANLTENAAKLVLMKGWLRDYVYWTTRSTSFREQVTEQTRVAAQPKLALQRLGCITIPNADLKSQEMLVENMVRFRDSIVKMESSYRKKLADLATLRQSLLQKAFSGQLT